MKTRKNNITTRPVIVVSAILLAASVILGVILANRSKALMKMLLNERMLDIANTSAAMLDGDALKSLTVWDKGTPEYQDVYDALRLFQDNTELEFIYTVREIGDGTFIFLIDPAEENASDFGELVEVTDALRIASLGTSAVDETPYQDAYGRFYSAYSPVYDSSGRVAGIVAVDFRADWYENQLAKYTNAILLFTLLFLIISVLGVFIITRRMRSRFRTLEAGVAELAKDIDDLTRELDVGEENIPAMDGAYRAEDEVDELGDQIRAMREKLRRYAEHTRVS